MAWTTNGDFIYNKTMSDINRLCNKEQIEKLDVLADELVPFFFRDNAYARKLKGDWLWNCFTNE